MKITDINEQKYIDYLYLIKTIQKYFTTDICSDIEHTCHFGRCIYDSVN